MIIKYSEITYLSCCSKCKMGGKKKTAKKVVKKKRLTVAKTFKCLFCNHENAVTCSFDREAKIGELVCRVCGNTFQNFDHLH
jgi:transcription elongation factor Elf1